MYDKSHTDREDEKLGWFFSRRVELDRMVDRDREGAMLKDVACTQIRGLNRSIEEDKSSKLGSTTTSGGDDET
ncbi:unnamed protein product [Dovyalis caffra]|uniref:Uncharacterized protein n=1 Tax=Dovyalis caffra TaxID=77055 RepID=A0AAV1QUT1_9ROSI|nr:unnamed protein product [Dovyalis caffra]